MKIHLSKTQLPKQLNPTCPLFVPSTYRNQKDTNLDCPAYPMPKDRIWAEPMRQDDAVGLSPRLPTVFMTSRNIDVGAATTATEAPGIPKRL